MVILGSSTLYWFTEEKEKNKPDGVELVARRDLEPGDEIGIFDLNGIPEGNTNCDDIEEGEILVGSGGGPGRWDGPPFASALERLAEEIVSSLLFLKVPWIKYLSRWW